MNTSKDAPVTAKDIGKRLGLSQPTVSRILSGAGGYRVSATTRQRVLETATQLGYRPNALARSLRRGRTNIVGLYTGYGYLDARNPFQAEVIGGIQRAADKYRLDILLHGVFRGASTDDIFNELLDGRIDGLLIHTFAEDPLVTQLRDSSLPVVAIADAVPNIPSVVADDAKGMAVLLNLLWERGHRRIAFLRPIVRYASVENRLHAFRAWAEARCLSSAHTPVYKIEAEQTLPALEAIQLLPKAERPTAVCCWNDLAAFDLLLHCRNRDVSVPETLAVVGFDGLTTDARLCPRPLVTVGTSWPQATLLAVDLLVRQIEARGRNHTSQSDTEEGSTQTIPLLTCLPVTSIAGDTV